MEGGVGGGKEEAVGVVNECFFGGYVGSGVLFCGCGPAVFDPFGAEVCGEGAR